MVQKTIPPNLKIIYRKEEKTMNKKEYFIVGDFYTMGKIESCLIRICGADEQHAEKVLPDVIANPPRGCLGNIKIASDEPENCWWRQGGLD